MDTIEQNFAVICRKFNQFLNRELQEVDLTAAELTYLNFLLEQNGMTQDELAKSLCVDKAAVTRMIQRMEKKGIVQRQMDDSDKRANRIYPTEKAYYYQKIIENVRQKWIRIMDVYMTEEQQKVFEAQVAEIAEKVKKAVP